jgi:hypothetical protein
MSEKPKLEVGTGFNIQETKIFLNDLVNKEIISSMGRMIHGAVLRINCEEYDVTDLSVEEVKEILDKNQINY